MPSLIEGLKLLGIVRRISTFYSNKVMLNIDFVTSQGSVLVLSGWTASRFNQMSKKELSFSQYGKTVEFKIFNFERLDVSSRFQLTSSRNCFGFLCVISSFSGELDSLIISSAKTKFSMAKLRYSHASSIAEILSHVPERQDEAKKFIEGFDLSDGNSVESNQIVIRHKDKDVEKIRRILQTVDLVKVNALEILYSEALPEIHRIWKSKQSKNNNRELKVFGEVIEAPKVSVIIPLYGRYDFMQHQLANFSADPFMHEVEVIYVLDDPALQREVLITAHGLFKTFRYPFKLVLSERNRGFAGANNLGVEFATSEHLLLLNSDILPKENGWLGVYLEQFTSLEDVGIMGATLTYEDETIQHAGMEFREDSHYPGIWMNHHPYKGVPVDLVPLDDAFQAPITTGACMLMTSKLYRELEGFDPMYVLGDFEDSDLCLKVIDRGFKVYVSGKIRLYHLERLSQDLVDSGDWKFKLTLANGAYQANKWRNLIQEVSA